MAVGEAEGVVAPVHALAPVRDAPVLALAVVDKYKNIQVVLLVNKMKFSTQWNNFRQSITGRNHPLAFDPGQPGLFAYDFCEDFERSRIHLRIDPDAHRT